MRRIDKSFLTAGIIFTIAAWIVYFFLTLTARRHAADIIDKNVSINQAPLIFIDTVQEYWWFGYLLLISMLALQWFVKRTMS